MRGGALHNALAALAAERLARAGWRVRCEHPVPIPGGRSTHIDVLADRDGRRIAVQVETTTRGIRSNAARARAAGLELWFLVPNHRLRAAARERLDGRAVLVILPNQLDAAAR